MDLREGVTICWWKDAGQGWGWMSPSFFLFQWGNGLS